MYSQKDYIASVNLRMRGLQLFFALLTWIFINFIISITINEKSHKPLKTNTKTKTSSYFPL